MRIGSLFSGYGGLELGIEQVMPAETAWHVEHDAAPSRVLAHHWPDVPNYGDITAVDWATVEPVDILCGGFPCQDVSLAGLRKGLHPDTRSGLWSHFALAIDALRPPLVIVENVRGLLSAQAASNLEPDAWDLGDRNVRPPLRALGAVLGDLADLGYDTQWAGVRAADAGAPHGRFRVFLAAYPQSGGLDRWDLPPRPETEHGQPRNEDRPVQNPDVATRDQRRLPASRPAESGRTRPDPRRRTGTPTPHADRRRHGGEQDLGSMGRVDRDDAGSARERERARELASDRSTTNWGVYGPGVHRWEAVTGRTAPAPLTEAGRIAPVFVEWMMGLPAGHVTDPAIGLTRNEQLKALGNGVVPQQAALALTRLLQPAVVPA
jgi:DNA (cytosine-5)-methyltransferase 1